MSSIIGIKGTITYDGQVYDFNNNILNLTEVTAFPPSEGPRSIVQGNDSEQAAKYINAYSATDEYITKLKDDKMANNELPPTIPNQLCQLTHCLGRTRQETDHVLTMVMNNKALPQKRKTAPIAAEKKEGEELSLEDEIEKVSEEIKRQRALDTTEYFSAHSSDEDNEMGDGGERVGILDQAKYQDDGNNNNEKQKEQIEESVVDKAMSL